MNSFRVEPESRVTSTNGINFEYQSYASPGIAIDLHVHQAIEVLYIKEGIFEVNINEKSFTVTEGDLVLLRKYALHSVNILSENGGGYFVLKIHPSILGDFTTPDTNASLQSFFVIDRNEAICLKRKDELENSEILFAMNEIITTLELNDSFSFFSLKVNTGRFLLAFLRDSYTRSPSSFDMFSVSENLAKIIQKAVDYININFRNDITADEAAKFVGLSYNYFSNCFSKIVGQTFRQYLNKTRINHAKHLLLCSNRNISEVADDVGYNSVSYFILEFRRESGMTPAKFVKKFKYRSEN